MVTGTSKPDIAATRPFLRGRLHEAAAWFALGAGSVLVATAPDMRAAIGGGIYALTLVGLFSISAIYHRVEWRSAGARARMRRADHALIFLLIAGTYTPVAMLGLPPDDARTLLITIWTGAAAGVTLSIAWVKAPKALLAAIAVAVGWTITPYFGQLRRALGAELWMILAGGIVYTAGALVYALKRPNPSPRYFGYHEVFHALTIVAAALHLAAIVKMIR
ncbi:MAG TPA: hemolysin III family protein [Thermoanaerobaculia bacterium]|nr:hemolysin III family protein [Thermoanaerobaculia bacterium]